MNRKLTHLECIVLRDYKDGEITPNTQIHFTHLQEFINHYTEKPLPANTEFEALEEFQTFVSPNQNSKPWLKLLQNQNNTLKGPTIYGFLKHGDIAAMTKIKSILEVFTNYCICRTRRKQHRISLDVIPLCYCTLTVSEIIDLGNNQNAASLKAINLHSGWPVTTENYMALKGGLHEWDVTRETGKNIKLKKIIIQ